MQDCYNSYLGVRAKKFVKGEGRNQVSNLTKHTLNKGNFDFLGKVSRHTDYKDKVYKNFLLESYLEKENITKPLGFRYGNANVDAELPSVKKYDKYQPSPNPLALSRSYEWMFRHFHFLKGSQVLSTKAAIENIDKTTSPGYPWTLWFTTKQDMIDKMGIDFYTMLNSYWTDLLSGQPQEMGTLWTNSVKGEMRPEDKVLLNKLRTFCASPVEHSISLNRLCLDMNNRFYEAGAKGNCWSKVGISKYNLGWHKLACKLGRFKQGFALDMSEYDSSVFQVMLKDVCRMRQEFLVGNFEHKEALEKLYNSIINSIMVLTNGDVIQKSTGMPSGSANTVVDNTFVLFRVLCYCYFRACFEQPENVFIQYGTYEQFIKHVEAALYGDDNTFMVSDEIISWFNADAISKYSAELGMKVTAENDVWEPQSLEKLTFLSHGFQKINKIWVPVPNKDKVLCSLLYGAHCDDIYWHLMRAYALRVECYFNKEALDVIEGFIGYLQRKLPDIEPHKVIHKGVTKLQIDAMYRSHQEIESLYLSRETCEVKSVLTLRELDN